jgi:hypothetical protein
MMKKEGMIQGIPTLLEPCFLIGYFFVSYGYGIVI